MEEKNNEEKVEQETANEVKKDDYVMELEGEEIEAPKVESNKPATWWLRLVSGIIDFGLVLLAAYGFSQLLYITPMANSARELRIQMVLIQDKYKLSPLVEGSDEVYGHKVYTNEEEYQNYTTYVLHTDEEPNYIVVDNAEISSELSKAFSNALKNDETYQNYRFDYRLNMYGMDMLALFVAESIVLLAVPLINKRRATPGKLLTGLMLINSKYETPARWFQVVGRFAWQYLIESALFYLFIETWTLIAVPALIFIITLFNKKRRTLHDFISVTRVIDKKTFLPIDKQ